MMIFGYALGVTPTAMLGRGLQVAAGAGEKVQSNNTSVRAHLKLSRICPSIGFRILQKTILKYAVPLASAAVGSGYNM